MATKTTKKTTAKPVAAKKTVKKVSPKKTTRATSAKSAPKMNMMASDVVMNDMHNCKCGANCHCGADCKCGSKCNCGTGCNCGSKCKCHCHGFGHFIKKLIIALILLALGFAAAKVCCCGKGMRGPRVHFAQNGCMVEESVKCPKLRELLPAMDINQDGCITREEYREIKRQMRQQVQETETTSVEVVEVVEDAE